MPDLTVELPWFNFSDPGICSIGQKMEPIEASVEALCATIMKTDAEEWEVRNKAMLQLTDIVVRHRDDDAHVLNELFTANVFRALKEPVKNMVSTA